MSRTNQKQPTATPSTPERMSKYARKQQRLREEAGFGISYEVKAEEEPKKEKTLAQMVEDKEVRLTDAVTKLEKDEESEETERRNRWSRLPKEEKDRLVEKWEKEVESYLFSCSILQGKIDRMKTAIGGFHALITRNHKRIKEIKGEGEK